MPGWPDSITFTTDNLDAGSDDPSHARADLFNALESLEDVILARGEPNGVASLDEDIKVPIAQIPLVPSINGVIGFIAPGSSAWPVPDGITKIYVECWGAGGGGGFAGLGGGGHGGGGGGGGGAVKTFVVVPGESVLFTVGAGGSGAPSGSDADGSNGGASSVTVAGVTIQGLGGGGGKGIGDEFGGGGGSSVGGDINVRGGTASSGHTTRGGMGGGNWRGTSSIDAAQGWGGGGFGSGGTGDPGFDGAAGGILIMF